jgi:hypothetical protein
MLQVKYRIDAGRRDRYIERKLRRKIHRNWRAVLDAVRN